MKRLLSMLSLSALALAGLCLADEARYHEDFHYSYPQSSGGRLSLDNFNGSVEITGWDQNTVDVSGTKYADTEERLREISIEASNSGNSVQIRTVHPVYTHGNMGAKYVIRVPRQTELNEIRSSNGSMRIEGINGNAVLHTSNGSVRLSSIHGDVDATSSNGGVEVKDVNGRMSFHTSNGSVHADGVEGSVTARTSNGGLQIRLRNTSPSNPIRLESSNGSVDLELERAQAGDVIVSTSNGPITLRMPADANAVLSAHTSGHDRIYSDFGVTMHGQISPSRLEGNIGSGGPRIELATSNGTIRVLRL